MYKIKVVCEDVSCDYPNQEETLLDAVSRQGVSIPYACKGGGCGMCKVKVEKGEFERGRMSKAMLTDSDREQNYTLACKTYARSDLEIVVRLG